jgi:hypothetical protein
MVIGERPAIEEPRLAVRRQSSSLWSRRRLLVVFLPVLAAVLTGAAVLAVSGNVLLPFERVVTLEGKMASKRDFFEDEEVQRLLLKHHIRVHITSTGSREVAGDQTKLTSARRSRGSSTNCHRGTAKLPKP